MLSTLSAPCPTQAPKLRASAGGAGKGAQCDHMPTARYCHMACLTTMHRFKCDKCKAKDPLIRLEPFVHVDLPEESTKRTPM